MSDRMAAILYLDSIATNGSEQNYIFLGLIQSQLHCIAQYSMFIVCRK